MRLYRFLGAWLALPLAAFAAGDFPAGSDCAALKAEDAVTAYRTLAAMPASDLPGMQGREITVRIDDPASDRWDSETLASGKQRLIYRMGRNDVTEGWNWHPEADHSLEDYYRYKYFPLGEREGEVAPARTEGLPGQNFEVKVVRRDAYYFAFDNPYEFYSRNDADGGFAAEVAATAPVGKFVLLARGRLAAPWRAESTTYWRAIPAKPVDLTLKNRYLMGRLETFWFCGEDGRILAKLGK